MEISAYIPAAIALPHQRGVDAIQRIPIQEEMSAQGSTPDVTWRFLAVHMNLRRSPGAWTLTGASRSFRCAGVNQLPILAKPLLHCCDDRSARPWVLGPCTHKS